MADSTPYEFTTLPSAAASQIVAPPATRGTTPVTDLVYQSYVGMNDGSVGGVFCYRGGSPTEAAVVWGTATNPSALFSPGSVALGSVLISATALQHNAFNASVTRGPDGYLYIVLRVGRIGAVVPGLLSAPPNEGTYLYRSTDEGASWSYVSAIQEYTGGTSGGGFGGFGDTGEIYFSDSGRWIVPYGRMSDYFGASAGRAAIAISDDNGATWANVYQSGNFNTSYSSRQIIYNPVDGYLYYFVRRSQNPNFQWFYSDDDGSTWNSFEQADFFSGDPFENHAITGVAASAGMNWFVCSTQAELYSVGVSLPNSSDPVSVDAWPLWNPDETGWAIQPIGDGLWVLMDNNGILDEPFEATSGCDPGAITVESQTAIGTTCNATVTVCATSAGVDGEVEVVNPETGGSTILALPADAEVCTTVALTCGTPWTIEVYGCPSSERTLISTIEVDCACGGTLDIQGFTPCRSGGVLGDGSDLRVLLVSKGAGQVIAELKPTSGNFTRVLDATSELTMGGVLSGTPTATCCDGWEDIKTWATEIIVYRDGRDAWAGPVTDVSFEYGIIRVDADDITAWWDRRTVPTLNFVNDDLTDIFSALNDAAMEKDPSPNIVLSITKSGVVGDRSYIGSNYQYVSDAIDELAKTGVDYTAYGRTVIVGGEEVEVEPYVTLLDEHWTSPPKIRQRGNEQCTVAIVKGKGVQAIAEAPAEYLAYYGRIERVFDEPNIEDEASAKLAAETRVDLLKDAVYVETPTNASLKTTAPITLPELIPGMIVRIDSRSTCSPVVNDFRLQKVTVDFNGTVAIDLQPVGHTTSDDSTPDAVVT